MSPLVQFVEIVRLPGVTHAAQIRVQGCEKRLHDLMELRVVGGQAEFLPLRWR
jgi:hypothetical protein